MPSGSTEKQFTFEATGETLNAIKNDHLEMIKMASDERSRRNTKPKEMNDDYFYDLNTNFEEIPKTIGEPAYWDYMKGMKSVVGRRATPIVC